MQILSSLSGLQFSAASAGYAPTNSGDVSAIASAYQVVSATATQLYAGTAYVTSVNDNPLSASRAGNAANASLSNSAWYDGTGRLISALPDSAAVSSIASSYAESAASSKLDESATADFYSTSNPSGFVDSSYVDSSVSSKQDTLTFAYDADSAISSINGSALAGGGGVTGDYVEKSAINVTIGDSNSASSTALSFGFGCSASGKAAALGQLCSAKGTAMAQGSGCTASSVAFAQGYKCSAAGKAFVQGDSNWAYNYSFAQGANVSANSYSFAQGNTISAAWTGAAIGVGLTAKNTAFAIGTYNLKQNGSTASTGDSAAFVIGDGTSTGARHDLMVVTKDGEITMYSGTADTSGTGIMSSIRAISAAATGGVDSATVSAIASSYAESAASSKLDESATADFYSTSNPSGFITGVDLSDYQPTSAMTAYQVSGDYAFNSSLSSKLDASAASGFYTTANESGFVDSSYVDSAVSSKQDTLTFGYDGSNISSIDGSALAGGGGGSYSAGNMIKISGDVISFSSQANITNIKLVTAMPQAPDANVLYLISETV